MDEDDRTGRPLQERVLMLEIQQKRWNSDAESEKENRREKNAEMRARIKELEVGFTRKIGSLETGFNNRLRDTEVGLGNRITALETGFGTRIGSLETTIDKKLGEIQTAIAARNESSDKRMGSLERKVAVAAGALGALQFVLITALTIIGLVMRGSGK
jgi:hypothetical protein